MGEPLPGSPPTRKLPSPSGVSARPRECHPLLRPWIPLVRMLGEFLGRDHEVLLHDVSAEPPFIVAIENGALTGRDLSAPMTDLGRYLMTAPEARKVTYLANYRSETADGRALRSGVTLIRDGEGHLVGFLCVNYDLGRAEILRDMAEHLTRLAPLSLSGGGAEHFASPAEDRLGELIDQARKRFGAPLRRLRREERLRLLAWLDERGCFELKEAISRLGRELGRSRFTLYGDLRRLRGGKSPEDPVAGPGPEPREVPHAANRKTGDHAANGNDPVLPAGEGERKLRRILPFSSSGD